METLKPSEVESIGPLVRVGFFANLGIQTQIPLCAL